MITAEFYREAQIKFAAAAQSRHSRIRHCPHTKDDFIQDALLAVYRYAKNDPNLTEKNAYKIGFTTIKNKAIDIFRKEYPMYLVTCPKNEDPGTHWMDKYRIQPSFEDDVINTMLLRRVICNATETDLNAIGNVFSNQRDRSMRQALKRFRSRWTHLFYETPKARRKMPRWRLDVHTLEGTESRYPRRLKDAQNHRSRKKWPTTIYKLDEVWTELERSYPKEMDA